MFRRSIIILLLLCIAVSFSSCRPDWVYELPNDYCIFHNSTVYNSLGKITDRYKGCIGAQTVVETYIHEFSYNEQYVAVKQFDPEKLDFENFNSNDFSNPTYYLVDTISGNIYGPYKSQEEFDFACKELKVVGLGEWISTRSDPNCNR